MYSDHGLGKTISIDRRFMYTIKALAIFSRDVPSGFRCWNFDFIQSHDYSPLAEKSMF